MHLTVTGFEKPKSKAIIRAAKKEWPFDNINELGDEPHIECCGDGYLGGGETEDEFAKRMAQAVFKANGKPCKVHVEATYLDDPPHEDYDFDEDNPPEA
jgi:hypothetical protein